MMKTNSICTILLVISFCEISKGNSGEYEAFSDEQDGKKPDFMNLQGVLKKQFALDVAVMDLQKSVVCSPMSALFSLGKLALGAKGKCLNNILTAIGLSKKSELGKVLKPVVEKLRYGKGVSLNIISRIYVSNEINISPRFHKRANGLFGSSFIPMNFRNSSAVRGMNDFASLKSNNQVINIIHPKEVAEDSSMILMNTVYFKGMFKRMFDHVTFGHFFSPNSVEKVPMMTKISHFRYSRSTDLDAQVVEIPYAGGVANLVIFLPNSKHGLPVLLQKLKLEPNLMQQALETLEMENMAVTIPKFRVITKLHLRHFLTSLGIAELFHPQNTCFDSIIANPHSRSPQHIYLSKAIQKTVVEVNEQGYKDHTGSCTLLYVTIVSLIEISRQESEEDDASDEFTGNDELTHTVDGLELGPFNVKGTLRKHFALDIALLNPDDNVVCSPEAALFPLGKLALGAHGVCLKQILAALGLATKTQIPHAFSPLIKILQSIHGVTLPIISKIFVSHKILLKKKFVERAKKIFQSTVTKVNFSAPEKVANSINTFVSSRTGNLITELIRPDEIHKNSSMVLINVVHFTGEWEYHFGRARFDDFNTPNSTRKIIMLTREGFYYYYDSPQLDAKLVEIPYKGSQATFLIFLPNSKTGLPVLLEKIRIAPEMMQEAVDKMTSTDMSLSIPRFTIEAHLDLKTAFDELGVKKIFTKQNSCLDTIARKKKQKVHVSLAVQRVLIEVDDHGWESKLNQVHNDDKTASILRTLTDLNPKLVMTVNQPFLFFVKYQKEELLSGVYAQIEED